MPRVSFSDAVGLAGIVFGIVLIVLDKAGKLTGAWLYGLLVVAGVMTLCIAIGNTWVMDAPAKWKLWRGVLMFGLVALTYGGASIWISGGGEAEHPHTTDKPQQQSAASLQLSSISVLPENAIIEGGRKLGFSATFTNKGPIGIREARITTAIAVTFGIPTDATITQIWDNTRAAVRRGLANTSLKGVPVGIGNGISNTETSAPLEHEQARQIVNGTVLVLLQNWVGWIGDDGLKGEIEVCLYLQKPRYKVIRMADMNNWGVCLVPQGAPLW